MAEVGLTQLQMMLVRQGGFGTLPLSILPPTTFLAFIRVVEQVCLDEKLPAIMVYWAKHNASLLLPEGPRLKQLISQCKCVSVFSDGNQQSPDEWCILIESSKVSLVVHGQAISDPTDEHRYQCAGSMDTELVKQSFAQLLPKFQLDDPAESNRLEDARVGITHTNSSVAVTQRLKSKWPIIKAPTVQSFVIPPQVAQAKTISNLKTTIKSSLTPSQTNQTISASQKPVSPTTHDFSPTTVSTPPTKSVTTSEAKRFTSQSIADDVTTQKPIIHELPRQQISAQSIITEIIGRLRHSHNLNAILQFAIEKLTQATNADRGLIWQVVGDQLAVTHEYAANGHLCFISNQLRQDESTAVVLEFLSRFPDESGTGVISIHDTTSDINLHKISPTLSSLIELGGVKARLMVQLRSRGVFFGFLELQQASAPKHWGNEEAIMIQSVAEMLSVVVQQSYDQTKIEVDAREMKLINDIASLFRESREKSSNQSLVKSVLLVADHMGFVHAQLYLHNHEENTLMPQISNGESLNVPLSDNDNPFVSVFKSGHGKVINMEETRKSDPYFTHDTALILPLISEGERLGVIGLWQRQSKQTPFRTQDKELGLTIAGHLSNVIRAETAVLQIKAEQARAALINQVSSEIRQSLKEVDQIMNTLVTSLKEHFSLSRCLVSLYDHNSNQFTKYKSDPILILKDQDDANNLDNLPSDYLEQQLFSFHLEELRQGNTVFLDEQNIIKLVKEKNDKQLETVRFATLVPLFYGGEFKAALCLLHNKQNHSLPKNDMNMVDDLANRVAAVMAHAELFGQVERQAITDPMTSLFNRRYFQDQLTKEIDRYQRFGHPFSLIIADLDLLKKINDTYGHTSGDLAIKHIANVMKNNVRDVDTVGRFGGEEFVVLLPETELRQARVVAERICTAIAETPVEGVGTITASLGLATFPLDAMDRNKLFELADRALFLAKGRGRNQVCSVSEDLLPSLSGDELPLIPTTPLPVQKSAPVQKSIPTHPAIPPAARITQVIKAAIELPSTPASQGKSFDLTLIAQRGLIGLLSLITKALEELDVHEPLRTQRVYNYARQLARNLNLPEDQTEMIALAAVYSNLGKLTLPKEILAKKGPLTAQEMEIVKSYPSAGARLLETAKLVSHLAPIIESYQENWDGTGYPHGLKGEEIPLESRIISLVDDFVAMTSNRPYRSILSEEEAIKLIEQHSGKDYDPQLVKVFLALLNKTISVAKV